MAFDVNRSFVLFCCTTLNLHLSRAIDTTGIKKMDEVSAEAILYWARIASYTTYYLIEESDPHYQQVIQNLEISWAAAEAVYQSVAPQLRNFIDLLKERKPERIET